MFSLCRCRLRSKYLEDISGDSRRGMSSRVFSRGVSSHLKRTRYDFSTCRGKTDAAPSK